MGHNEDHDDPVPGCHGRPHPAERLSASDKYSAAASAAPPILQRLAKYDRRIAERMEKDGKKRKMIDILYSDQHSNYGH